MSHLRYSDSEHDSLHCEPPHRTRGFDLGGIVSDVGGVAKGIGEGAVDTVTGIADAVTHPVDTAKGVASLVTDPKESWPAVWHGLTNPIVEDWKNGNEGEAVGRGIFGVLEVIVGSKGVSKLGKVVKKAPDTPDAPKVTTPDADAPRKPDADAPKPDADDLKLDPEVAARRTKFIDDVLGPLPADLRALAMRMDVEHVFRGGNGGGGHVAPRFGQLDDGRNVIQINSPKGEYLPGHTWRAKLEFPDGTKKNASTMYPREWSPRDVLEAIRDAEKSIPDGSWKAQASGAKRTDVNLGTGTARGIEINIQRAENGEIITAYPRASGEAFT